MPQQKFKKGDIVIIQSPAAPNWMHKDMYHSIGSGLGKPIAEDGDLYLFDMRPDIVGQEDEVLGSHADLYQGQNLNSHKSYSLKNNGSWYNESQLKLKTE